LLLGYYQNLFAFFTERPPLPFKIAERPVASPLARYQATIGDVVSTFHHRALRLGPLDLEVLKYLDGNHTSGEILDGLTGRMNRGELPTAIFGGPALGTPGLSRDSVAQLVAACLERLRGEGLLR
jgi:methyltransferase-like protein